MLLQKKQIWPWQLPNITATYTDARVSTTSRTHYPASQGGSTVKIPPANAGDTRHTNQSLRWEDALEEEMAIRSSILAGKPQGQRSLAG